MRCPHPWNLTPQEAISPQRELILQPIPAHFEVLGAADIGYVLASDRLTAVTITFRRSVPEPMEIAHCVFPIAFPYIPELLSFRGCPHWQI